jgi:hypothetical protein
MSRDLISESYVSCKLDDSIRLKSQTGFRFWKNRMRARRFIGLGKTLNKVSKPQLTTV